MFPLSFLGGFQALSILQLDNTTNVDFLEYQSRAVHE